MRRYLIAGNWKMNGRIASNAALLDGIREGIGARPDVEVLVCPPFPYLAQVAELIGDAPVALGAQTVSEHGAGAYTGEVEAAMLAELGVRYVIVGHSERRALFGESDGDVANKFVAAVDAGLRPVLCVGETLDEREAGQTTSVVGRQIDAVVDAAGIGRFAEAVIAYEPVWAIGTGRTATPEMAQEVHAFIRERVATGDSATAASLRVLYGGSMKAANAAGLLAQADIDGGLIGGASLKAEEFMAIVAAAPGA